MHQNLTVSEIPYPDWPLETLGISVTAGSPKGSGTVTYQTSDKLVSGGVWGYTVRAGIAAMALIVAQETVQLMTIAIVTWPRAWRG